MTVLQKININAPANKGLATEFSNVLMSPEFATKLDNCELDSTGVLVSRRGWSKLNSVAATGAPTLDVAYTYITRYPSSGSELTISTGGNKIWLGTTSLSDITGTPTITADNWKFQSVSGYLYGFQQGHIPIYYGGIGVCDELYELAATKGIMTTWQSGFAYSLGDLVLPTTRNGYIYECTTAGTSAGSEPTWDTDPDTPGTTNDNTVVWTTREHQKGNEALISFGRLWMINEDANTIYYSDLLVYTDFWSGSSGSISLDSVWSNTNDEIIGLATHNNNLVIFCKNSIVIYASADDVTNISLVEVIDGSGCIARDSIQNIGNDILYLAKDGIRSLSRTVLQNKMPLSDLSINIRQDLIDDIASEDVDLIRSTYNEAEGFYLINFPTVGNTYYFNLKEFSKNQKIIPMIWDIPCYGMTTNLSGETIMGFAGGFLGKYSTYLDDSSTYSMDYESGWIALSEAHEIILKTLEANMESGVNVTVTAKWYTDFSTTASTTTATLTANVKEKKRFSLAKSGNVVKIGLSATINNGKLIIPNIALYVKSGKLLT